MRIAIAMLLSTTLSYCASSSQPSRPTIGALRAMTKRLAFPLAFPTWHEHRARRRELDEHNYNYDYSNDDYNNYNNSNEEDEEDEDEGDHHILRTYDAQNFTEDDLDDFFNSMDSFFTLSTVVTIGVNASYVSLICAFAGESPSNDIYLLRTSQDDESTSLTCFDGTETIDFLKVVEIPYDSISIEDQDSSTPLVTLSADATNDEILYTQENPWVHSKCSGSTFDKLTISPPIVILSGDDWFETFARVQNYSEYTLDYKIQTIGDEWYDTSEVLFDLQTVSSIGSKVNITFVNVLHDFYVIPRFASQSLQVDFFYTDKTSVFSAVRYRNKVTNEVVSCTSCDDDLHCPPPPPATSSSSPPPPASSSPSPTSSPPPPPESRPRTVMLIVVVAVVVVALLAASLVAALRYGSGSS